MRDARGAGRGAPGRGRAASPPTSRSPAAADVARAAELEACDVVNVKLAPERRLQRGARDRARREAATGSSRYLSSTLDGPWGIAAALQLAASEDHLAGLRPGHAGAVRRRSSPARCRRPRDGLLPVPQGPGLGVEVERGAGGGLVEELGGRASAVARPLSSSRNSRTSRATSSGRSRWAAWPAPGTSAARRARGKLRHAPGAAHVALVAAPPRWRAAACRARRGAPRAAPCAPWPALRSSWASSAGSWLRRPARCAATSSGGCAANTGWRLPALHDLLDRDCAPSRQPAPRRALAAARAPRVLDARARAHQHEARVAAGLAQARRAARGARPSSSRPAPRPAARPRRSRPGGPRATSVRKSRQVLRIAFADQPGHRRPRVAALHEAGDEHHCGHVAHAPRSSRSTGRTRRSRRWSTSWRAAGCGTRSPPGLAQRAARCWRSPASRGSEPCRCSTSARRGSWRSGWPRRAAGPWRSPARRARAAANLLPARGRGARGARAADRAHRRPPARAARRGRGTGDRPGEALRRRGEVVRGGGQPRAGARERGAPPLAGMPGLRDRGGWPARAGAPELPSARAAGARAGGAGPGAVAGPARAAAPWVEVRRGAAATRTTSS